MKIAMMTMMMNDDDNDCDEDDNDRICEKSRIMMRMMIILQS